MVYHSNIVNGSPAIIKTNKALQYFPTSWSLLWTRQATEASFFRVEFKKKERKTKGGKWDTI